MLRNAEEEAAARAAVRTAEELMAELTPEVDTVRARLRSAVTKRQLKTAEAAAVTARTAGYG